MLNEKASERGINGSAKVKRGREDKSSHISQSVCQVETVVINSGKLIKGNILIKLNF